MRFDKLIVKEDGRGAIALFHDEVVAVILNGKRVDTNRRIPAKKVAEIADVPKVRNTVNVDDEPRYVPFMESP